MNLDDSQKQKVTEWIEAGLQLAEIQKKLDADLKIKLTYMETRFLIDDLKLKFKEKEIASPVTIGAAAQDGVPTPETLDELKAEPDLASAGKVSVKVDQVTRPGALVSGEVTFSDGQNARWQLDQTGRLGLSAPSPGYRPPEADIQTFQLELQKEFAKLGL